MRARNLKPSFFKNEDLADLSPHSRLLFAALWCLADKAGRLEWRSRRVKAEVFPYEDLNIDALLDELVGVKEPDGRPAFVSKYKADGMEIVEITNFQKFQNPYRGEPDSKFPPPPEVNQEHSKRTLRVLPKNSESTTKELDPSSVSYPLSPITVTPQISEGGKQGDETEGQGDKAETKEAPCCATAGDLFEDEEKEITSPQKQSIQKPSSQAKPDPLADYPRLSKAYPKICDAIKTAHPSARLPRPGSKQEAEWKDSLSKLARLDRFSESKILDTLKFIFKSDHPDAAFWRGNIASLAGLRKRTKSGLTKFGAAHEKWKAAQAKESPEGVCPPEAVEAARQWRERCAAQQREKEFLARKRAEAEAQAAQAQEGAA